MIKETTATTGSRLLVLALATGVLLSAHDENPNKRMHNATLSFGELMRTPDKAIPQDLFEKARCVIIVPDLKKGAFGVGGKYGRGYALCRKETGPWGSPAAIAIEGGASGSSSAGHRRT